MKKINIILIAVFICLQFNVIAQTKENCNFENELVPISSVKNWLNKDHYDTIATTTLAKEMSDLKIPGVGVVIIDNYKIVSTKYYGLEKNGTDRKVNKNTIFQSGSTSKLITTAIILDMAEKGIIDLDTDVNQYLKSWKMPIHESGKKVTARMLLTHTSGINRPGDGVWHDGEEHPTLIQVLNGEYPCTSEKVLFKNEPGTKHSYSNHGYLVLQQLIEDYYNKSFTEVVNEQIFNPLKLKNSCMEYPLPERLQRHFVMGHDSEGKPSEDDGLDTYALAQGGWMSPPVDIALFGIELMKTWNGKSEKILTKESVEKMLTTERYLEYNFEGGIKQQGLGCFLLGKDDNKYFFHPGHNSPGVNCLLICHPKTGKGAVIMTNGMKGLLLAVRVIPAIAKEYNWPSVEN